MPFVSFVTSEKLDARQRDSIRSAIWDAITVIPGKTPEVTMIEIRDGADLQKGPGGMPAIFMETRLFTRPAFDAKKQYCEKLFAKFQELLNVEPARMYFNITEFNEWGSGGNYKSF